MGEGGILQSFRFSEYRYIHEEPERAELQWSQHSILQAGPGPEPLLRQGP